MKTVAGLVLVYLAAVTCTLEASSVLADPRAGSAAGSASSSVTKTIFAHEDGSFFPTSTSIQEGDSVVFMGPIAGGFAPGLSTTFSVVRTKLADINANLPCMTTTKRYDIDHDDPELDNELVPVINRHSSKRLCMISR